MLLPDFLPRASLSHRGFTEGSIDSTQDKFSFLGTAELYAEQEHIIYQLQFKWCFMNCLIDSTRKKNQGRKRG